ncbi:MAG: hypothetical protein NVS9B15_21460 [Acidobacteriaceae bacterium]
MLSKSALAVSVLSASLFAAPGATSQSKHHERHAQANAAKPQAEKIIHGPTLEGTGKSWALLA